jgi:NADPH-dependent ferric siderophore reductase
MHYPTYRAEVLRTEAVTPRLRRVVLGGAGMDGFTATDLPDERIKLLLPRPGHPRPLSRTITVRSFDARARELAIEIALHDGPAARWSLSARPGDVVEISDSGGGYEPGTRGGRHVLLGDEAALPGLATIAEALPGSARADVFVEIADPSARLELTSVADLRVRWLERNGGPAGARLAEVVRELEWPRSPVQVWAAGEALAMRSVRRFVRDELALPRDAYRVVGYWRDRLSEDQAIEAHLAAQAAARAAGATDDEIDDAGLY